MKQFVSTAACLAALASPLVGSLPADAAKAASHESPGPEARLNVATQGRFFRAESAQSDGTVTIGGKAIAYRAVAGTLVVHPKGWDDVAAREKSGDAADKAIGDPENPDAEASMFYVAYFAKGAPSAGRPITFLYNGGPGSSTVWLHMGAFGPHRVVTSDHTHTPAAPYRLVNNDYSLLDASDLVFIDAPGTGFSRIAGKDKDKSFWGVDPDAHAFSEFIMAFLSKYDRWNSPKYLFGESYGTPRSAVLINELENDDSIDFNGVILLSQILNFDLSADSPELDPGTDVAYVTALPTYAATAWYHRKLSPQPPDLLSYLREVETFAEGDYANALEQGYALDPARKRAIATQYARYTGLPVAYVLKANLRVNGGEFEKNLLGDDDLSTGRLDTRFAGPSLDPLSEGTEYDPQSSAISSAYVSTFNQYVRDTLHFGDGMTYKPEINVPDWNFSHAPPGQTSPVPGILNVMPDLSTAMKTDPNLKVMVNGGYYDLATPFYEGWYEDHHLQIPASLDSNIEYHYYESGHMVYANDASLKLLHANVSDFIRRTHS